MEGEVYLWSKYNHLKIQKRMQINFEDTYLVGYEGVRVYDLRRKEKRTFNQNKSEKSVRYYIIKLN